jgi:hypothetical protein
MSHRRNLIPAFLAVVPIVGALSVTGCISPAHTPAPAAVHSLPQPAITSRPVSWVTLSQNDGLATGDIIAVLPHYVYAESAQFRTKYEALAAIDHVLPMPDWASAQQANGTYHISVRYVNYYRALSEYQSAMAAKR